MCVFISVADTVCVQEQSLVGVCLSRSVTVCLCACMTVCVEQVILRMCLMDYDYFLHTPDPAARYFC